MNGIVILFLLVIIITIVMVIKNNKGEGELKDVTDLIVWTIVGLVFLMLGGSILNGLVSS